ncbi:phage terminase large subunit [Dyadobacter bucti]|uniref:phage terminase large subunit n=1 Tax=Dyadobacter bucti TaxID=2572203 RepID=UPI0011099774|nr:phage terminase large subunit [Dyadobacter bucti]
MIEQSSISYYQLLDDIEREACRDSFYEFLQSFWDVIIKETPVFNWHIKFLCDELQELSKSIVRREAKPYDLIVNIPPGTTKSTVTTIMWPAWLWTQDPTIRIITNSYSMDLSIEHAVKSRDILTSEKFKRLFPEVKIRKDKGAKSSYENTNTGARYTTSTGGTITGKHAHILISDDPLNPSQAASDADRKAANEHTKTLSSRKVDKANTPVITIMQRLHEEDVTGYLLKKKGEKIRHLNLPAEDSEKVLPAEVRAKYISGLLDPVRLNRSVLDEALTDLGSMGYAGQYDQSPTAKGGNIVKATWFKYMSSASFQSIRTPQNPVVFFMDTAYTDKDQDNDPTGIIATCKIGADLYITKAAKVYKEFPELIKFVPDWVRANGYSNQSTLRIEPKASGLSVVQQLKRTTDINITTTPTPKDDKKTRLTASSPKIECGRVILITDTWNEDFVDEICGFPNKTHDEYVDLIAYAVDYHLNTPKTQSHAIHNAFR